MTELREAMERVRAMTRAEFHCGSQAYAHELAYGKRTTFMTKTETVAALRRAADRNENDAAILLDLADRIECGAHIGNGIERVMAWKSILVLDWPPEST